MKELTDSILHGVSQKRTHSVFFHNSLKFLSLYTKFVTIVAEKNTNSKYWNKIRQLIKYSLLVVT